MFSDKLPDAPSDAYTDSALIEEADRRMCFWQWPPQNEVAIGSAEHRDMFCRMFLESHNPYKPAIIEWPHLSDEERAHVTGLRRNLPWSRMPGFLLKCLGIFIDILKDRMKTAGDLGNGDNFTATGHEVMGIDAKLAALVTLCLSENDRRFAGYDARLLRPQFGPRMTRLFLPLMRLLRL